MSLTNDELKALYEQATQGEWEAACGVEFNQVQAPTWDVASDCTATDARLIAAMHSQLPRLLAESEALARVRALADWFENSGPSGRKPETVAVEIRRAIEGEELFLSLASIAEVGE